MALRRSELQQENDRARSGAGNGCESRIAGLKCKGALVVMNSKTG